MVKKNSIKNQGFMDEKGIIKYGKEALTVWEKYFQDLGDPDKTRCNYFIMRK